MKMKNTGPRISTTDKIYSGTLGSNVVGNFENDLNDFRTLIKRKDTPHHTRLFPVKTDYIVVLLSGPH